jgi:hypothetical protein
MFVSLLIAAPVDALRGAAFIVALLAPALLAIVAAVLAPAAAPDRVRHHVETLHGHVRIIALDN